VDRAPEASARVCNFAQTSRDGAATRFMRSRISAAARYHGHPRRMTFTAQLVRRCYVAWHNSAHHFDKSHCSGALAGSAAASSTDRLLRWRRARAHPRYRAGLGVAWQDLNCQGGTPKIVMLPPTTPWPTAPRPGATIPVSPRPLSWRPRVGAVAWECIAATNAWWHA
jgi:hypothetical protein